MVDYDPDYVKLANGDIVRIDRLKDSSPATGMTLETCMAVTSLTPQTSRVHQTDRITTKTIDLRLVVIPSSFVAIVLLSLLISKIS